MVWAMKMYDLHRDCQVAAPLDEVWAFFSDAQNLGDITPPFVGFTILTPLPIEMRVGALIDYRIRLHGIPINWRTEITAWEPSHRFVDEQLKGPYRRWIHEHHFESTPQGTRCLDHVRYAVWGGAPVRALAVKSNLERIFNYREQVMLDRFGVVA